MNKKLFAVLGLGFMSIAALLGTNEAKVAKAADTVSEEIVLFENGAYATGMNTDRDYCAITDNNLVVTYSAGWQNRGLYFAAAKDWSDAISITVTATKVGDGTLTVGLATYSSANDWQAQGVKGAWGSGTSTFNVADLTTFDQTVYSSPYAKGTPGVDGIIGVLLRNDGNAATTMAFSKVSVTLVKPAEAPAVETESIFAEGAWNTEITGAVTYGGSSTPTINGSNELVFTGWSTPRAVFANEVDFTKYEKLEVTFSATAWANFGFLNKFGGSGDLIGMYDAGSTPAVGKWSMSLDPDNYTANSKSMWGTDKTGSEVLDLEHVKGFSIKSSSEIKVTSIVGVLPSKPADEVVQFDLFKDGAFTANVKTDGCADITVAEQKMKFAAPAYGTRGVMFAEKQDWSGYDEITVTAVLDGEANFQVGIMSSANTWSGKGVMSGYYTEPVVFAKEDVTADKFTQDIYSVTPCAAAGTVGIGEVTGIAIKNPGAATDLLFTELSVKLVKHPGDVEPEYEEVIPEGTEFDFIKDIAENGATIKGSVATTYVDKGGEKAYPEVEFPNDALMRQQLDKPVNLSEAYYQSGTLHFSLKNDEADEIIFRLFSGTGDGDMPAIQFKVAELKKDGEFHDYSVALNDLPTWTNFSSWTAADAEFDMSKSVVFDYRSISGFGLQVHEAESEGEEDTIKVGIDNVYVDYTAKERTLTGIEIAKNPTKNKYNVGEKFVGTGMEIKAVFGNGDKTTVMPTKITAPKEITKDTNEVEIRFTHGKQSVYATYEAPISELESITIETAPTKQSYVAGEMIDLAGLVVKSYDGVDYVVVENSKLELNTKYAQAEAGTQTITVSYGGKTATFDITVAKYDAHHFNLLDSTYYNDEGDKLVEGGYKFEPADKYTVANSEVTFNVENNWTCYRYSTDFKVNVNQIYNETDGVTTLQFAYKTEKLSLIKLGLGNVQDNYDTYFRFIEVPLDNDGEEHVAVIRLDLFDGEYNGAAWSPNTTPATGGEMDFTKVSTVGLISSDKGAITIKSIGFAWAEDDLDVKIVDTWAPTVVADDTLPLEVNAHYGDEVNVNDYLAKVSVFDGTDSKLGRTISKEYVWSEGALDNAGKLLAGDHTLTIFAKDTAGNVTEEAKRIVITFHVAIDATGIELDTSSAKLTFEEGEEFSATGLKVKVVYEDGSKEDVALTDCTISGYNKDVIGEQTITVTYGTFTATYKVVVNEKAPEPCTTHVDENGDGKCDVCGEDMPKEEEEDKPGETKTGCFGSIAASSILVASVSALGASLLVSKKRKEDK